MKTPLENTPPPKPQPSEVPDKKGVGAAATCSASLIIDVLRGPDVVVSTRAIDSNIKSSKHGINWTKTRRHLQSALQAAKQGNVVKVTILMQRTSLPNIETHPTGDGGR